MPLFRKQALEGKFDHLNWFMTNMYSKFSIRHKSTWCTVILQESRITSQLHDFMSSALTNFIIILPAVFSKTVKPASVVWLHCTLHCFILIIWRLHYCAVDAEDQALEG